MKSAAFFVVALLAGAGSAAGAQAQPVEVALVWRFSPPNYAGAPVQALQTGMAAPELIGSLTRAIRSHPGAGASIAIDADAVSALERAAAGDTALRSVGEGSPASDPERIPALLRVLVDRLPGPAAVERTIAARRWGVLAANAGLALAGDRAAAMSARDLADLAGLDVALRLASAGRIAASSPYLSKSSFDARDLADVATMLARADRETLDEIRALTASGTLEIVALPAHEPVLPLLVDGGGKTSLDPNAIIAGAAADAAADVESGLRAAASLGGGAPGLYSPFGAYDDATAALVQSRGASYALFSDRTLQGLSGGGSFESLQAAERGAKGAYLLQTSKTEKLPTLFWRDDESRALNALAPFLPATAMSELILGDARRAAEAQSEARSPAILVLTIDLDGAWARRPDRAAAIESVMAALSRGGGISATTPKRFLAAHPALAPAYGYAPASTAGGLDFWTGTPTQRSMWQALADARKAAGGDSILAHPEAREALLNAEAAHWFAAAAAPSSPAEANRVLRQFRTLIAAVYRGAGKPVPAAIAPVVPESPAPGRGAG